MHAAESVLRKNENVRGMGAQNTVLPTIQNLEKALNSLTVGLGALVGSTHFSYRRNVFERSC